ncbi:UNVERIFIED_ORG: hypothetical protein FHR35_008086 [Microbispora rosea subsp. rosea]
MAQSNELGDFLRARRARLRPEQVGLPAPSAVAGLSACGARNSPRWPGSAWTTTSAGVAGSPG